MAFETDNAHGAQKFIIQNLSPPPCLNIDNPGVKERWKEWKASWDRYILLSGVKEQPKEFQSALLLHTIGAEAVRVHGGMQFEAGEDKNDPAILIKKYDEFLMAKAETLLKE